MLSMLRYICGIPTQMYHLREKAFQNRLGLSGTVVPKLMKDLFGLGYELFTYNWYTSEEHLHHLQDNGTVNVVLSEKIGCCFQIHLIKSDLDEMVTFCLYHDKTNGNLILIHESYKCKAKILLC